ncbi:MAG: nitroreductase family protein [Chloroflexi bacterium]|nr:nitroreductase family protein [Chloroflexota bacterium]
MQAIDVMQAVRDRRSIRKYRPDPIPQDALQQVLEAFRLAPSWENTQTWRLIVVRDPAIKDQLVGCLRPLASGRENPAVPALRSAPVALLACAQMGISGYYRRGEKAGQPATDRGDWAMFDLGIAMENLALAAHALGLGTVHAGLIDCARAGEIVRLPPDVKAFELVPLGYPDEAPSARPRKPAEEVVFYDQYGRTAP